MSRKKKILVVVGAGASIDFGMPSVTEINKLFIKWAKDEFPLASNQDDNLYSFFEREIERYKRDHLAGHLRTCTNFEEVLYNMYLMPAFYPNGVFTSSIGAFLGVRKLPDIRYLGWHRTTDSHVLGRLAEYLIESLLKEFRKRCQEVDKNKTAQWNDFLTKLDEDFELAIVSLNYDNLVYQALSSLNTGFDPVAKLFKPEMIWQRKSWRCLLHLHGSVHFDFWEGLRWIDDLAKTYNPDLGEARGRSSINTKEGAVFPSSEIVAGYGKLSRLSSQPFRTYYAELDRLVHECEGVLFLGYGFADNHLDQAFSNFRNDPRRPVVVIDKANGDTMTIRSSYDVSPTAKSAVRLFCKDPLSMKWLDNDFSERVERLNEIDEFESSNDPNIPLSIWYGGMQKACCNYEKIKHILTS
ncbi:MAG: SIR2 family protein [Methylobacter sp.]|uniref:SIR2 family protein n=1 Tax=Methylobacter sp. TaxID=2051955 RepID=UPI00272F1A63|nr:SIR2 family protein [Methylobacter sp.]MDP1665962.1 SIR2 family protein [Methylobacter sp.]